MRLAYSPGKRRVKARQYFPHPQYWVEERFRIKEARKSSLAISEIWLLPAAVNCTMTRAVLNQDLAATVLYWHGKNQRGNQSWSSAYSGQEGGGVTGVTLKHSRAAAEDGLGISDLALRWLQVDPIARLIVDEALRVLWRNIAAERLLLDCPDLDARDGQLAAEDRSSNIMLTELVQNADDLLTCTVPCLDGDGHLLFKAARLSASGPARIALCIQRTGSGHEARYADFSRAFSLTASEFQIVKLLISGHTADSIAASNGSSIGTVRSHIRSIYNKLDVRSREMMFHRLQPFRLF